MRIETTGNYYDSPQSYPFQHFPDILEDESGRLLYKGAYNFDDSLKLQAQYELLVDTFTSEFGGLVDKTLEIYSDSTTYAKIASQADIPVTHVQWLFERCLSYVIHAHFIFVVDAAILGGLKKSPISQRMLD
ncbi:hypothetical protein L1286_12870 [Pseudoalteromonas sp. SMS1]|uniref:hypothetical protein n=1 Tax=Pseudoalteromonas sp. SMS1 TaxID=2908894 RepID=UPI001F381B29|nr:hypothetical protein [Pseudoalteromonas sp. SMS1]MCF2858373.1 hypothetical protein [Pseudoalteromonas sp. SMS1]